MPTKREIRWKLLVYSGLLLTVAACATVPISGRSQLNLLPSQQLMAMSLQSYEDFLAEHKLSHDAQKTAMVKRVGGRIQKAVEQYLARNGQSRLLEGYNWQYNLVEDETANAWCMPGGKVVVFTGILPLTGDETGLAVVMGHEIAHAIANHGNERMSHGLATQLGGMAVSTALREKSQQTRELFMTAYGLGAQVGFMLPYSRLHESEADHLGLIFMALAGYAPETAVPFWQRMAALKGNKKPPELLSTHPADQTRIDRIKALLPEAMAYRKQ